MTASLAISGQVEAAGVTAFANEATDCVNAVDMYQPSLMTVSEAPFQDLKSYFARPRLVTRGTLGNTIGSVNGNYVSSSYLSTVFPQWVSRLAGVYGIRFTMHFRLQVAATAFHQGLVVLNWQYLDTTNTLTNFVRNNYSGSSTNIPHVRLDLSEKTMVELEVPFIMRQEYMPVSPGTVEVMGAWGLNLILPVQAVTGLQNPSWELYLYLTNVELYGVDNAATTLITLQSGTIGQELKESRLISRSLDQTIKIANFLGRRVPMLSSITGPTEWALGIASGVAKYFGYSRPMLQDPPLRVVRGPYGAESNVDVPAAGFVVGPLASNTLDIDPQFSGTKIDEMSFDFIKSQWSQVCVGYVNTTDTHALVIYATPISPSCLWFRTPAAAPYCNKPYPQSSASLLSQSGNSFLPTSIMHLASNFRLWTGGLQFRFTFAKTKFHGGRYMISFNPGTTLVNNAATNVTITGPEVATYVQPFGYSMICDLRDGNVFEFDVPYISEFPYVTFQSSIGGLSMVCIDPLQASSSVTGSVPLLVEVRGASDFEVADFAGPFFVPQLGGQIYQQSGEIKSTTSSPSSVTIGEKLTSVKQLIQIPSWRSFVTNSASTWFQLMPWYYHYSANVLTTSTTKPNTVNIALQAPFDTAACWAYCYVFCRGSTDHHFYSPYLSADSGFVIVEQGTTESTITATTFQSTLAYRSNQSTTPKVISMTDAPIHVRSPAYQGLTRNTTDNLNALAIPLSAPPGLASFEYDRGHFDRLVIQCNSTTSKRHYASVAAGDDAMLGQYVGPPLMYIPNSANSSDLEVTWLLS